MILFKILLTLLTIYFGIKLTSWYKKRRRLIEAIEKLPGPPSVPFAPIINHALVMIYLDSLKHRLGSFVIIYHLISTLYTLFPDTGICRFWLGWKPIVVLFSPENIEQVLNSTQVINKADEYRFFEPWIGEGLITSKRNKWRFRRKILTPAFHFRILNDFLPIMNAEATKLVEKLNQNKYLKPEKSQLANEDSQNKANSSSNNHHNKTIDIAPLVALCTLDTICETAMGVNINCQANDQTSYVKSVYEVTEMALTRVTRPWLWFDWIFYLTESGRRFTKAKDTMHEFTTRVILERKSEWERVLKGSSLKASSLSPSTSLNDVPSSNNKMTFDEIMESALFRSGNKRLAFLDLMLHQHLIENNMTIDDIREEVDTFMFAGHDTTAMSISWTLYMLGLHESIQDRVRQEIDEVVEASDLSASKVDTTNETGQNLASKLVVTDITSEHMRELRYLDRVIKESLRMWPSIPFVARQMTEDIKVGEKYLIPEGSTCMIFTHALHNNPKYYPKPEVFDPDRFLPETSLIRHPFAYIPFSAGPRNCIGQKFAQMEMKVILAKIIRNYYIKTLDHRDKLEIVGELVLRSRNGLNVQIIPRYT